MAIQTPQCHKVLQRELQFAYVPVDAKACEKREREIERDKERRLGKDMKDALNVLSLPNTHNINKSWSIYGDTTHTQIGNTFKKLTGSNVIFQAHVD